MRRRSALRQVFIRQLVLRHGSQPTGSGSAAGGRLPKIIANIEPTDRAMFLTPDAVSGDQNLYQRQYREELRTALGGVDELGISSGATAYEIKSPVWPCCDDCLTSLPWLADLWIVQAVLADHLPRGESSAIHFAAAIQLEKPASNRELRRRRVCSSCRRICSSRAEYKQALDAEIRECSQAETCLPALLD